jgi:hypothetical protein
VRQQPNIQVLAPVRDQDEISSEGSLLSASRFVCSPPNMISSRAMITIGNVAVALEDAREHALPGRTAVAVNEVMRRLRELLPKAATWKIQTRSPMTLQLLAVYCSY